MRSKVFSDLPPPKRTRSRVPVRRLARPHVAGEGEGGHEPGSPESLLEFQQTIGNQAVARLVQPERMLPGPAHRQQRPLQREDIGSNPQDLTNAAGQQTEADTNVGLNAAVNQPGVAAAHNVAGRHFVKVVAGAGSPFDAPPETCPVPERVYEDQAAADTEHQPVNGLHGTVDAPIINAAADDSLYIGNQPHSSDIEQGGIGDCYGLSTIIEIAAHDPGKIKDMITPTGLGADVAFFKRAPKAGAPAAGQLGGAQIDYQPVTVHADLEVAVDLYQPGNAAAIGFHGGHLAVHGAQFLAADHPSKTAYWAAVEANKLEVHRNDTYQMARWVPLLEKAWARFGEVYGQYGELGRGQGPGSTEKSATAGVGTQTTSGYTAIESGVPGYVLNAFYGAPADQGGTGGVTFGNTTFNPGANLVLANQAVVDQLLLLCNATAGSPTSSTTAPIVTANTDTDDMVTRLGAAIPVAVADPDWASVKSRTRHRVQAVLSAITSMNTAVAAAATQAQRDAAKTAGWNAIGAACRLAVQPHQTWSLLERPSRSNNMTAVVELMLDLVNIGHDKGGNQRNFYGGHSYAVLSFVPSLVGGAAVPSPLPTGAARATFIGQIDPAASTVTLQNPHHANAPDPMGEGRAGGSDGVFTETLDSFLRNVSRVDSAVFNRT